MYWVAASQVEITVHADCAASATNWPVRHEVHWALLTDDVYLPGGQASHAALLSLYLPNGHPTQMPLQYAPIPHGFAVSHAEGHDAQIQS